MDRKEYWNEKYVKYWKEKVSASNDNNVEDVTRGDSKTTSDEQMYELLEKVPYHEDNKVLDFGCGFGRLYDYLIRKRQQYYGVDISSAMIDEFSKQHPETTESLFVSEGEALPFEDETFSLIVCYGVFDACYQEKALQEMLRVCSDYGHVVLTGKNKLYFQDDEGAIVAEENARKKGHPNFFTDVSEMKKQLQDKKVDVIYESYYLRREDMETGKKVVREPEKFYAWEMILQKKDDSIISDFSSFSSLYSKTWDNIK